MTKLLINENPLIILPSLAVAVGLNEAIILQQIHYWLDPRTNKNFKEGTTWVYNTYAQWQEQFPFYSEITIRRTIKSLEDQKLIFSKNHNSNSFAKVKWYTINYEKLKELEETLDQLSTKSKRSYRSDQIDQIDRSKGSEDAIKKIDSYLKETEITTQTTTKNSLSPIKRSNILVNREIEMLKIWDKIVKNNSVKTKLTSQRTKCLTQRLSGFFNDDIALWEEYCHKIISSKFLMGEVNNFKASLDWCLREEVIIRILEGEYGVNQNNNILTRNTESRSTDESEIISEQSINGLNEADMSKNFRKILLNEFGASTYNSWFAQMESIILDCGILRMKFGRKFTAEYIKQNYLHKIKQLCDKEQFYVSEVEVVN